MIWQWASQGFTIPLVREIGSLVIFVAGIFAVAWYLPKLMAILVSAPAEISLKQAVVAEPISKLDIVLNAIVEARQITPEGEIIRVYIAGDNRLNTILPEELKSILLKLQNDTKVLVLKSFPEGMIATGKSTAEHLHFKLTSMNDPSLTSFTVSLLDGFDKYIKNEKN